LIIINCLKIAINMKVKLLIFFFIAFVAVSQ
jgi:hypothetical protein